MLFFFFSSRRRHTRYWRDWSSDVCSSDLGDVAARVRPEGVEQLVGGPLQGGLVPGGLPGDGQPREIGRASCRERVEISVVAVSLKKKKESYNKYTTKILAITSDTSHI